MENKFKIGDWAVFTFDCAEKDLNREYPWAENYIILGKVKIVEVFPKRDNGTQLVRIDNEAVLAQKKKRVSDFDIVSDEFLSKTFSPEFEKFYENEI